MRRRDYLPMVSFVLGLVGSAGCAAPARVGPAIDDAEVADAASTTQPSPYTCDIDARVPQAVMADGSTEDAAGAQNVDPESGSLNREQVVRSVRRPTASC